LTLLIFNFGLNCEQVTAVYSDWNSL